MSRIRLLEPILDQGVRSVNFFNGRLLSGEDLTQERTANRDYDQRLGQAIGEGVAYGLEVFETTGVSTPAAPVVTIERGLAVNGLGQTLRVPARIDVALIRPEENGAAPDDVFHVCEPVHSGGVTAGDGVYLLVLSPVSAKEGRAPVSGLGTGVADCNSKYLVDGVCFDLVKLNLVDEEVDEARLRNYLAYRCFGVIERQVPPKVPVDIAFGKNPFGPVAAGYGLLDDQRPTLLTPCDVPLALLYWTASGGIRFIDGWAVRRRLTAPAAAPAWPLLVGERRLSEAEAMFLQFQEHVADLLASEAAPALVAAEFRFHFLPPAGLLPIVGDGSPMGFHPNVFFGARASRDVAMIDANLLRSLLHESLYHEPIDVAAAERVQLYRIWENVKAVEAGQINQLSLVFASQTLPYRGVARYGRGHWDLSRFAPSVI